MDFFRNIRFRLQQLEQLQVIDLKWLQLWLIMLLSTFGVMTWLWEHFVVEVDPTSHFPPSLLSPELKRRLPAHGFMNEREVRSFAIREIDIAVIACRRASDQSNESAVDAITMMKSAATMSKSIVHFHIFTEDQLYSTFMLELDRWPAHLRHRVSFKFSHVTYPESLLGWKNLHRPCSSFKLFIPHVLKDLDFALYLDSDSVFLKSLDRLWGNLLDFDKYRALSLAAVPTQTTLLSKYGIKPLDTRAVLFDIYKLRHSVFKVPTAIKESSNGRFQFELSEKTWHPNMLHTIYGLFSQEIVVPDQDIFAILHHFNPDKISILPCSWNFRWQYCEAYLQWMRSLFLNATLTNWPIGSKPPICSEVSLVHSSSCYMDHDARPEFSILQQAWRNSSYDSFNTGVSRQIRDFLGQHVRSQMSPCFSVNLRLFQSSLEVGVRVN